MSHPSQDPSANTQRSSLYEARRIVLKLGTQVVLDAEGRLARVHPHDPSWQAWLALEFAVLRDIVPDFPLINKSFNLSYSGVDL